jgi:hypothetical protein
MTCLDRARGIHVMHEGRGDQWTFYFGRHQGARYVGMDLRGWTGWSSSPRWLRGGWEFYNPSVHVGRLFTDGAHRSWSPGEIKLPAKLVDFYRWKIRPSGRRYVREHGHEQPVQAKA